jgi:CopA family copper-resistance protein
MGASPLTSTSRRGFLRAASGAGALAGLSGLLPAWAQGAPHAALGHAANAVSPPALSGDTIDLAIGHAEMALKGRRGHALAINGTVPGPLLRLREGQRVRLNVANRLEEDTSIHWHGLILPFEMDGVPGVSFPGVRPGETFAYEFPIVQSGTYWYHSHSGLQEQMGVYGPIIIDPAGADPIEYDREHVIVLSEYTFHHPHTLFRRLKNEGGVFNYQKQTVAGLFAGCDQTLAERREWAAMRMDPTDISDVTGAVFTFLLNGRPAGEGWTGLFRPGERVRLRLINAGAQTIFNVRLPDLPMTVVQADGLAVRPVEVRELQIGNGETYDVIVVPNEARAYGLVAEAVDRSGMAFGTLAPAAGQRAEPPALRGRPLATMKDMGMDHGPAPAGGEHAGHAGHSSEAVPGLAAPRARGSDVMGGMHMDMRDGSLAPQVEMGPGVQSISAMPADRTGEPGQGLESVGHRVLVYRDLVAADPNPDTRAPGRAIEIRLTGNMERFIWGINGRTYADRPPPLPFRHGERVRVTVVNDTMMAHPIHLHGHFFELVHAPVGFLPRKHTVIVAPGGQATFDFTAERGDWAFHCHMLYHMHGGMFQVFQVRDGEGAAA